MPSERRRASFLQLATPSSSSSDIKVCADCARHIPPEQSILVDSILCARCRETRVNLESLQFSAETTYDYPTTPSSTSTSISSVEETELYMPPRYHHHPHHHPHHRQELDYTNSTEEEDLFADITHLRIPQRSQHCLYSGATFRGVQKSGRNSYDVTVTILDVDFPTSHLSGYLTISGLTEDYPTLTTYFDAEIIGPTYGFLTAHSNPSWGASEAEDMTHWNRFAPFRWSKVQRAVSGNGLTMPGPVGETGCVFMRWKEKFLVPDHRVKDINGASFAGFYYVCVEFNPKERLPIRPPSCPYYHSHHSHSREHEDSPPTASMTGYYFHQNSEPYQQLSLHHVPESTSGSFEFR